MIRFGIGDPVGAPFRPRHALVQAVQGLVRLDLVLAPLVGRRLVGDDDRDLVEGGRERLRDRVEGAADQLLERAMAAETGRAGCGHRGGA